MTNRLERVRLLIVVLICVVCRVSANENKEIPGAYFGQPKPGQTPEKFAATVLASRPDHYVRAITFSAHGDEAYWPVIDTQDDYRRWIVGTKIVNGRWTQPRIASFSNKRFYDDVPFLTPNGKALFFLSGRPLEEGGKIDKERIWRMTREGDAWSGPVPLSPAVNGPFTLHQQISLDRDEYLYFAGEGSDGYGSLDIYCSQNIDGEYQVPANLGPEINGPEGDYAPTISHDGSYLIFTRNVAEGWSLFISFRTPEGLWAPPIDLRGHLEELESSNLSGSFITSDGKYLLFFAEQDQGKTPYWIETSFIESIRNRG